MIRSFGLKFNEFERAGADGMGPACRPVGGEVRHGRGEAVLRDVPVVHGLLNTPIIGIPVEFVPS